MIRHISRRIIQSIPTLFGVTLLSYLIMTAAPGGPLSFLAFSDPQSMTEEQIAQLERQYGLNDPWFIQYLRWVFGANIIPTSTPPPAQEEAVQGRRGTVTNSRVGGCSVLANQQMGIINGDFGCSFRYRRPVMDIIAERVPATLELGVASLLVALFLGIPIGILAAITRGGLFDNGTRIFAVVGNAIPNFWMGLLLLLIFAFTLDIFPSGGRCERSREGCGVVPVYNRLEFMVLPVIVLSLGGVAGYSRYMRTSMLETVNSDYVRTARSKGLNPRNIWMKHAARNALIPIATFLGPSIVGVLSGAAITEQIFSWPGLGQLIIDAVGNRDYPVIMASVVISAVLTVIAYLLSDILYALFDPRIRF